MTRWHLLKLHLLGYLIVAGQCFGLALLTMWSLQTAAITFGEEYDWGAVLRHLTLCFGFVAFYPGQTIWTLRLRDRTGREHTIVGRPPVEG